VIRETKLDLEAARQHLTERLHEGKTVHCLNLRDLIDSDLHGPRSEPATAEVMNVLLAESGERPAIADKYVAGVIERFLETREDLVQECAEEMENAEPDPCDLSRDAALAA
jgi:hypothetical protein